jgi:hypothetical protein
MNIPDEIRKLEEWLSILERSRTAEIVQKNTLIVVLKSQIAMLKFLEKNVDINVGVDDL